jgi:hypothetical protein
LGEVFRLFCCDCFPAGGQQFFQLWVGLSQTIATTSLLRRIVNRLVEMMGPSAYCLKSLIIS